MKKRPKLYYFITAGFLIGLLFLIVPRLIFPFRHISLQELKWFQPPTLIAVFDIEREGEKGALFLRLKDGKEQFFIGKWQVDYSNNGNAFIYGNPLAPALNKSGQQLYVIENGAQILDIQILGIKGAIASVQENPKQTYLAIESHGEQTNNYCLIAKISTQARLCEQINFYQTSTQALWNPQKDRELAVKMNDSKIIVRDPWEKDIEPVDPDKDQARYNELLALFNRPFNLRAAKSAAGMRQFTRLANIVLTKDEQGWRLYRIPLFSQVSWLVDGEHLLIKERDRLSILELKERKTATLLEERGIGRKTIEFRNNDIDQTL